MNSVSPDVERMLRPMRETATSPGNVRTGSRRCGRGAVVQGREQAAVDRRGGWRQGERALVGGDRLFGPRLIPQDVREVVVCAGERRNPLAPRRPRAGRPGGVGSRGRMPAGWSCANLVATGFLSHGQPRTDADSRELSSVSVRG
jgi:hypothetical protein